MALRWGDGEVDGVLFDLDDVVVPFHSPGMWQWAWRPQGPLLGERRVRAAVRRALKAWDRRRWQGLTGKAPPTDAAALRQHLGQTLEMIAGHPLPPGETEAVVRRVLRPAGEVERYTDVTAAFERLKTKEVRIGIATPLPAESARWLLHRTGLAESLLLVTGDSEGPALPARSAFRSAAERLGLTVARTAFVGDLFWSDVRAAARAGLRAVLLDRNDGWPKVVSGRMTSLDALEATFAAGEAVAGDEVTGSP